MNFFQSYLRIYSTNNQKFLNSYCITDMRIPGVSVGFGTAVFDFEASCYFIKMMSSLFHQPLVQYCEDLLSPLYRLGNWGTEKLSTCHPILPNKQNWSRIWVFKSTLLPLLPGAVLSWSFSFQPTLAPLLSGPREGPSHRVYTVTCFRKICRSKILNCS